MLPRCFGSRESLAKLTSHLEDTPRCLMSFLEFLLDGIFLGFEGEDGGVAFREGVELALSFLGGDCDEFGRHEVADGADVLLVCDSGEDAVEEFRYVGAGEGGVEGCVEGFVGALEEDCR